MLEIRDLHVEVEGTKILNGLNLSVKAGEIHAIMGPNGAGKSTLARVVGGHPSYEVTAGEILFEGENILEMEPEERSALGLFMSFQYPIEIPGVTNLQFLHTAYNARQKAQEGEQISLDEFESILDIRMAEMQVKPEVKERAVNENFSGGEKKRNEILQMAILDPKLAILDETDSGLDIDALKTVAEGIATIMHKERSLILITHYQRLLNFVEPHFVHVMVGGRIVESGGPELAHKLEAEGYQWVEKH